MALKRHSGGLFFTMIPSNQKMECTIVFLGPQTFIVSFLIKRVMYVTQKLLPMPRSNIMTSMRLGNLKF